MNDPKRLPAFDADVEAAGRDSRVDALLVEGLDRYFNGHFDEAIHLWTRVLFLDRTHASARAYIDRARGAMAERQRHAEVALQQVAHLLAQGRAVEARYQLQQATLTLGEDERTAALRVRLERLDRAAAGAPRIRGAVEAAPAPWGQWLSDRLTLRMWLAAAAVVVLVVGLTSRGVQERLGIGRTPTSVPPAAPANPVPVLTSADVALVRAKTLFARGRLAEALTALDRVGPEQAARSDADTLRVDIQRLLLAAAGEGRVSADGRQGPR
jgi:tetratricopeptide (TPR) repeat protein